MSSIADGCPEASISCIKVFLDMIIAGRNELSESAGLERQVFIPKQVPAAPLSQIVCARVRVRVRVVVCVRVCSVLLLFGING